MRLLLSFILVLGLQTLYAQDILMQGWYWDYPKTVDGNSWADSLSLRADQLGDAGITHMWLPPLSRASFGSGSNGYDPQDLYDLGEYGEGATGFGTRAEVDATIAALNAAGIKAVADVVYNHRDGGQPEDNPAVEGWIENYNCTKRDAGDNPYPSDRYRLVLPIGGSTGNGAGTYFIKVRSVSKHPDFYGLGYKFYAETGVIGFQNLPALSENEGAGNGGGDCGQGNETVPLGVDMLASIDNAGNCFGFCGLDEFAVSVSAGQFDAAGDTLFIYMNNTGGYSDHFIAGIWNGSADVQSQVVYQTYTDFTSMPSGQGAANYLNFRPNGNPTNLNGDEESMLFFYDYDQSVTSTQDLLTDWTKWLNTDVNIEGLRMDAVKHFPASYVSALMTELQSSGQSPDLVVGEFFDTNAGSLKGWTDAANGGMSAAAQAEIDVQVFDFALRQSLKNACDLFGYDARGVFTSGIVNGAGGTKDHVATFVNNHDYRQDGEPILNDPILPYAYILTNPSVGTPTVYYSDYYGVENADAPTDALSYDINQLIDIKKLHIDGANSTLYLNQSGSSYPVTYTSGFPNTSIIFQNNNGGPFSSSTVIAINFAGEELIAEVTVDQSSKFANGSFTHEATGKSKIPVQEVVDGKITIHVPARSYAIYSSIDGALTCSGDSILYVDLNASGQNNGSDWDNAFADLGAAMHLGYYCQDIDEIRIKEGTYLPTILGDRSTSFLVARPLRITGGFASIGNPVYGDQDLDLYPTVMSGDLGMTGATEDNSYHVLNNITTADTVIIESVIIEGGNADGAIIQDQSGAGITNSGVLRLKNVIVRSHTATGEGAAISNTRVLLLDDVNVETTNGLSDIENSASGTIIVESNSNVKD